MEFIGITLTGWMAILVTLSMAVLTVMMFVLGRERVHYVWGWFCLIVTVWIGAFYGAVISVNPEIAEFWWRISYVGVILIPFGFVHFAFEFTNAFNARKIKKVLLVILYSAGSIFIFLDLNTNLVVNGVRYLFDEFYYGQPGLVHPYFMILYVILVCYGFYLVYKEYKNRKDDKIFHQQVIYFFIANLLAFVGGSLNFLPIYEIKVHPASNISVAIGAAFISYAILRYRLFNARVATAQFLTFVLAAFAFVRLIVSDSVQLVIFNILLLVATLFVGLNLIRSVRREVEQRERLEILTKELEAANAKLKEADRIKSEFLSFASHQVKAPMTVVKGYASLIYDGSTGLVTDKAKETAMKIQEAADRMILLVNNLLDIRRIEEGKMDYKMEMTDMSKLLAKIVEELSYIANVKKLNLTLEGQADNLNANIDVNKFRQVIQNIVENALKYTKEGWVKVKIEKQNTDIIISVQDSGQGISREVMSKLFQQFERGESAARIEGTGIGLYLAKQIVESHKGKIWAESKGDGLGSTFYVKLPVA